MYDDAFVVGGAVAGRHRCNRAVAQRAPADVRTTDAAAAAPLLLQLPPRC